MSLNAYASIEFCIPYLTGSQRGSYHWSIPTPPEMQTEYHLNTVLCICWSDLAITNEALQEWSCSDTIVHNISSQCETPFGSATRSI